MNKPIKGRWWDRREGPTPDEIASELTRTRITAELLELKFIKFMIDRGEVEGAKAEINDHIQRLETKRAQLL